MIPLRDDQHPSRTPVITWALLGMNGVVFLFQLGMPEWLLERFYLLHGLVPARIVSPEWAWYQGFSGSGWFTLLSSMFIHGGWMHFLANMWTLRLFGDDVESRLGTVRFLVLYLVSGIAAGMLHVVLFSNSAVPTIGASGAVAGVMGAFLLLFPLAKIEILVPILFFIDIWKVPAVFYLPFWFLGELFSGALALAVPNFSNVAFWAHIGGFLMGIMLVKSLLLEETPIPRTSRVRARQPYIRGPGFVILSER